MWMSVVKKRADSKECDGERMGWMRGDGEDDSDGREDGHKTNWNILVWPE